MTPIPYRSVDPTTLIADHSLLWRDLELLANFIEQPKASRQERVRKLLSRPTQGLSEVALREFCGLFSQPADLWEIAVESIDDPHWFDLLSEHRLWETNDAKWIVPAWIAQSF